MQQHQSAPHIPRADQNALVVYPLPAEHLDLLPRLRVVRVHHARVLGFERCNRHRFSVSGANRDRDRDGDVFWALTWDDHLLESRLETPPPLAQRAGIVRANVRHGVDDEPALRTARERLDEERERREEAPGENYTWGASQFR